MNSSFYQLNPESVMNAAEQAGFLVTGEFTQLNSYENRVFDIRLETNTADESDRVIAKFYRPGRWSLNSIQDEHDFLFDLSKEGIKAVPPLQIKNSINQHSSIIQFDGLYVAFFPKIKARMPEEILIKDFPTIGRLLARIHNIGSQKSAKNRIQIGSDAWGNLHLLQKWVAPEVIHRYNQAAENTLDFLFSRLDYDQFIRIHGDCHRGNLLNNGSEFFIVDFDDFSNGPEIQDFWMLLGGDLDNEERDAFVSGYEELREFPYWQTELIEPLRALRIINYAAWIAKRWEDPSFPRLFPEFNSYRYWAEEVEALERISWQIDQGNEFY